jgi:hypothetical protein
LANGAHSEGINTRALADGAHAEGKSTIASGVGAHAEGDSIIEIKNEFTHKASTNGESDEITF